MNECLVVQIVLKGKKQYVKKWGAPDYNILADNLDDAQKFSINDDPLKKCGVAFFMESDMCRPMGGVCLCVDEKPKIVRLRCTYEIIGDLHSL